MIDQKNIRKLKDVKMLVDYVLHISPESTHAKSLLIWLKAARDLIDDVKDDLDDNTSGQSSL